MGDRANIIFEYSQNQGSLPVRIFFYTHWNGYCLPAILKDGLERGRSRWGDESYLARILFCSMTQSDTLGTTGYGIAPRPPNNGRDFLLVRSAKQTVSRVDAGWHYSHQASIEDYVTQTWSFEEYVNLDLDEDWDGLGGAYLEQDDDSGI